MKIFLPARKSTGTSGMRVLILLAVCTIAISGCALFRSPPDSPSEAEGLLGDAENLPECLEIEYGDTRTPETFIVRLRMVNRCSEPHHLALRPQYTATEDRQIPDEHRPEWKRFNLAEGEDKNVEWTASREYVAEVSGMQYHSQPEELSIE